MTWLINVLVQTRKPELNFTEPMYELSPEWTSITPVLLQESWETEIRKSPEALGWDLQYVVGSRKYTLCVEQVESQDQHLR